MHPGPITPKFSSEHIESKKSAEHQKLTNAFY